MSFPLIPVSLFKKILKINIGVFNNYRIINRVRKNVGKKVFVFP